MGKRPLAILLWVGFILFLVSAAKAEVSAEIGDDIPVDIAVDQNGNAYVTGLSYAPITGLDFATLKYSSVGELLWKRRYPVQGHGDDVPVKLALDYAGNLYLTGYTDDYPTSNNYATIKYSPVGGLLWSKSYGGPGGGSDAPTDLELDDSGNVFVTGYAYFNPGGKNYVTVAYTFTGLTIWGAIYDGPINSEDRAVALEVSPDGNIYVTGTSVSRLLWYDNPWGPGYMGPDYDYATIKLNSQGDTDWVRRFGNYYDYDSPNDMALDDSGNIFITGISGTISYKPDGSVRWTNKNLQGNLIVCDTSGNIYILNKESVSKYSASGSFIWFANHGGNDLALDKNGNVYIAGGSSDFLTVKLPSGGSNAWVRHYDGPAGGTDQATAIAVDDSGNVYVTGKSQGIGTCYDYATVKYSADGNQLWINRFNNYCLAIPGDADASSDFTLGDIIAIVNYYFNKPGCSPQPLCWLSNLLCRGDWNGSGTISLGDIIRGVNYFFNKPGGPWNALPSGPCCLVP